MRRIIIQWAGVGVLSLIGWGVGSMPTVTSWVPSSIMWGIAFIWLVGTLFYYFKRRPKQPQPKPAIGGLVGRNDGKIINSHFKGKIKIHGNPEGVDVGGLIGTGGENSEVVESSAEAEIEYKQD